MEVSMITKARHDELIAFLLGDGAPSSAVRRWLAGAEGQRELAVHAPARR